MRRGPLDDPDNYLPLATSLAEGRGFALDGHLTAYRPPLYPLVLAPVVAAFKPHEAWAVGALHVAFGMATIVLTAMAARRWGLSPPRTIAAAAIVALDPVLVVQVRSVMTETLAALLTASTIAALTVPGRTGTALGGFTFGLAALCRPSAWPCAALAAVAALAAAKPGSTRERCVRALALVVIAGVTVLPWTLRNALVFGEPVWTTTHGGYTLFLANNPVYYDEVVNGPPGAVWTGHNQWLWWDSVNRLMRGLSEPDADRTDSYAAARRVMLASASATSRARRSRDWDGFGVSRPRVRFTRDRSGSWQRRSGPPPLWIGLRGSGWPSPRSFGPGRESRRPAIVLGLTTVHAIYWTDQRMRGRP